MYQVLFYGVPQGCSFGSIVALEWLGQPYQLCRIEMLEQPWDPLYGQINALYQTPSLLTEDGAVVNESLAILLHLAARSAEAGLGPRQGSAAFDRLNQMLSYLVSDFFAAFKPLWIAYEKADLTAEQRVLLQAVGREQVSNACTYLNQLLADRAWLLGEQRSLADAYLAGVARWVSYHQLFDLPADYPNLARYLDRLGSDAAVRFATAIEQGEAVAGAGAFQGHIELGQLRSRLPTD
jgi:glutathione S-transferase